MGVNLMNKRKLFVSVSFLFLGVLLLTGDINGLTWTRVNCEGYCHHTVFTRP